MKRLARLMRRIADRLDPPEVWQGPPVVITWTSVPGFRHSSTYPYPHTYTGHHEAQT